ncbi:MAG: GNAT family N-acetyltransferase [Bacteriovoracaceae bacterium]|nr:GNAT family N-acetyltransferase [Bacteriovoracaceae bacterium]
MKVSALKLKSPVKQSEGSEKLSTDLWDLNWQEHLPITIPLSTGGTADFKSCSSHVAFEFLKKNYDQLFTENEKHSSFLFTDGHPAKFDFYSRCCDVFCYSIKGTTIGILVANPVDWSSYYIRYINILPAYRGNKLFEVALQCILDLLSDHDLKRVTIEVSPSNLYQIQRLTRLNFNITGTSNSERWGALLQLTKFLDETHESSFLQHFCVGPRPQLINNLH